MKECELIKGDHTFGLLAVTNSGRKTVFTPNSLPHRDPQQTGRKIKKLKTKREDVKAECSNKICSQTGQKLKTVQSRLCAHVTPNVNKNTNVVTWVFIRGSSGMLSLSYSFLFSNLSCYHVYVPSE